METRKLMYGMDEISERRQQLLTKPILDLVNRIIELENENERLKEYRAKLIKVRNLIVPDEEKRKQGRPRKDSEEVI